MHLLPALACLVLLACGDKEADDSGQAQGCVPSDESCNGVDDDCDGEIDEDLPTTGWYADADLDGWGAPGTPVESCSQPAGHVANDLDCDDGDDAVHPDGTESCNGVDDDCDGLVDANDSDVVDATETYSDADEDGWGLGSAALRSCDPPESSATQGGDCDDGDEAVNPGATELCNGQDDDCDELVDADDPDVDAPTWYPDADLDGYGTDDGSLAACEQPAGSWAEDPGDCDDSRADTHPGATEICRDGADNDCDGTPNECEVLGGEIAALVDDDALIYGGCSGFAIHTRSGDVTGDGQVDLVSTCYGLSELASNGGGVWIFEAPSRGDGLTTSDAHGYISTQTSAENLGMDLALGDVDGDGFLDVGMTATEGELRVLLGPARATGSYAADMRLTGKEYTSSDSISLALADLDGDGEAAIVLADLYGDADYTNIGVVAIITEPDDGGDFVDLASGLVTGLDSSDYFGWAVRSGDVDGDGLDDLLMSSRYGDLYGVWVAGHDEVDGLTITYEDLPRAFVDADRDHGYLGYAVAPPADFDGDGHVDLVVGAPNDASYGAGSAYLLLGPVESTVDIADASGVAWSDGSSFGRQIDAVPDMDGDGDDELLFGSYYESEYASGSGAAFLFYDAIEGAVNAYEADAVIYGGSSYAYTGYGVAGLDDLDGDGFGEIAVADYGYSYLSLWFGGAL